MWKQKKDPFPDPCRIIFHAGLICLSGISCLVDETSFAEAWFLNPVPELWLQDFGRWETDGL